MTRSGIQGIHQGNTSQCIDDVQTPNASPWPARGIPGSARRRWQDRDVEDEVELSVRDALLDALEVVPADGAEPALVLVVAASLHRLAVARGLAPREDLSHSAVRSAGLPAPALELLDHYFGANNVASDDEVRDGLFGALMDLSTTPRALRALNKNRPLSSDELLTFAQIYWNLDAQGARASLPIRAGQRLSSGLMAFIKVDGADEDYAELVLKQRADRTPGYARSAGAFYDRGARLAALVAKLLVDGKPVSVGEAKLRLTRTGRGNEWAIVWPSSTTPAEPASSGHTASTPTVAADPTVGTLRQLRQTNVAEGKLGDAAILCTTLIAILRERSEKSPGDHESQLAGEYLQAGLTYGISGRIEEALDHFASAERMSATLAELRPDVRLHRLRLSIARTMLGVLLFQVGRVDEAEGALVDAVALSQTLTDEDAKDEDMLAASLSMFGAYLLQADRLPEAVAALSRAVKIAQKLVKQHPDDEANQLQLANTLTTLGMLHLQTDEEARAEEVLTRSIGIAEALATSGLEARMAQLLIASNRFLLGSVYFYTDRHEAAEESLVVAVSQAKVLNEQQSDESSGILLVSAQYMLGIVYGATERGEEAATSFTEAATASRALIISAERGSGSATQHSHASTFLGSALFYLGVVSLDLERDDEAEAALIEAIEVLGQRQHEAADQAMLPQALDLLVELYKRQNRGPDAERLLELWRRPDDQSPEAPALT